MLGTPIHPNTQNITHRRNTLFCSPLKPREQELLISLYSQINGMHPTNNKVVRLDSINPITVSTVGFFDFLTTNLAVFPSNLPRAHTWRQSGSPHRWSEAYALLRTVRSAVGPLQVNSIQEVLQNASLANITAVSVMIIDSENRVGIVERPSGLAVASGQYAATATGTVLPEDLRRKNPFSAAACRELKEEVNLDCKLIDDGLVMPRQKMQPIWLFHGHLEERWEDVKDRMLAARDHEREVSRVVPITLTDPEQVARAVSDSRMSDTAAYHLWLLAAQANGEDAMAKAWGQTRWHPRFLKRRQLT